jgi:IS30 family transposase
LHYRAGIAQWKAELMARRPKKAKLVENNRLRGYVQDRLAGTIRRPDGRPASGPDIPEWTGRNKPHRQDRRWAAAWSPEQVANRLRVDFPEDDSMQISHEAIYYARYVQSRGTAATRDVMPDQTDRSTRAEAVVARCTATSRPRTGSRSRCRTPTATCSKG